MIYVIYQHLPSWEYNHRYQLGKYDPQLLPKKRDIPSMGRFPAIYMRHCKIPGDGFIWLLITYTNEVLDSVELEKVQQKAHELLKENKYI